MPDEPEIRFEAALSELETIVDALQRGEPELDAALDKYQKGVALLGRCYGLLEKAERSVAVLTGFDEAGEPLTTPFDPTATFDLARSAAATIVASVVVQPGPEAAAPKPKRKRVAKPVAETSVEPEPEVSPIAPAEPEYDRFDPPF
ncbi:exodeoxyribonuclease VII small subunit [Paludisphaera mucosa]|uniref:Exodeoxyribonuclease 7 small subunit n=1 Tax=Paludisphaera mucosa TaxID=3030827 RepID=A0ABT6FEM3_9BACT|nr:exodeoxyribonuclease VII small subunit [Paludisphaera mucosa]MDG3006022.1 exodeoxyribonuclease VII small subunit [Paludisphaera mucosa]